MKTYRRIAANTLVWIFSATFLSANYFTFDSVKVVEPQDTIDWLVEQAEDDTVHHHNVIQHINEDGDTTYITLGKKRIRIVEDEDETSLKIEKLDKDDECDDKWNFDDFEGHKDDGKFKGHWAGFEFGLNNYLNSDMGLGRDPESEFMDINTGKSWNFNLNFAQYSLGFGTDKAGAIIGMGIEWNNYHFNNDNSIEKEDGQIVERAIPETTYKNRFQTTYLTFPLLLEYQFPGKDREDRFYISSGIICGLKLFSNTKFKYTEDGSKRKSKNRNDYYLSPFRYGFTVRLGYKAIKLYANYYATPLFLSGRGPELYPVATGLVVSF